ncbi:MAG TPA: helix-turn-helix domain-containing protein [Patescibacteria group bacterium]|nr:helix-turn-helix domain-containing protein [Patescibacteria group bacterium]
MQQHIPESLYPITFREEDAKKLGKYLEQRRSVNLIGMRRVGISNFLRFFLYHNDIVSTYISPTQKHLFIPVDLNDLVEREIYPFWSLTLKRIVDACETSALPDEQKEKINTLFLTSIQSQDLFFIIDTIRKALSVIVAHGMYPTLFFIRFDRLQDAFNPTFFDNLEGLYDATHERLSYVFTSYRSLDSIFPTAKTSLSVFAQAMYMKPASDEDMAIVYESYNKRYALSLSDELEKALFALVAGNIQYLNLALILLHEKKDSTINSEEELLQLLLADERIMLESEELWESLTRDEQKVLTRVVKKQPLTREEEIRALYLLETGFISRGKVFSPLFEHFLIAKQPDEGNEKETVHMTKKEHLLFTLLQSHLGDICEREEIIERVWPEYKEFGVSDWAIDRLVARVRVKLREQKSPYEIVTVRTRGYKLSTVKE